MWLSIVKSRVFAWITAILSALAMVWVFWTSQRKIQATEVAAEGAIKLQEDKNTWNDEKAAQEIVATKIEMDAKKEALVAAVNARDTVQRQNDDEVVEKLKNNWSRDTN